MNEAATRIDFKTKANTASVFELRIEDGNGQSIDYTGSTFQLDVKARDDNGLPTGSVLLSLATGSGIGGDVAQGEISVTFPAQADTGLPPGAYIYDCLRLDTGVPVECVFVGDIDVEEGITAP